MKANPLIDTTERRSLAESGLMAIYSEVILSVLKAIEMMRIIVEMIRAPMANGAALNTYLRSGR